MVRIASPNPDFEQIEVPADLDTKYSHPVDRRSVHGIPVAFQVTSPFSKTRVLMPHSLVMHVNPNTFDESFNQKVERFQTRGGFVEQHWGQDLEEISAEASTGAFMHIETGLSSILRHRTIAWDRYRDLHDLFHNNGSVYDPFGNIVLQGHIMLMYDRGTYLGTFRTFEVEETADAPFVFKLNWSFKVEHTLMSLPNTPWDQVQAGVARQYEVAPTFQSQNIPIAKVNDGPPFSQPKNLVDADAQLRLSADILASTPVPTEEDEA